MAVAVRCFELGWIDRVKGSRAVAITSSGHRGFFEIFGIPISDDWKLPGRRDEVIADPMYSRTASHHIARSAIGRVRLVAIVKRHLPIAAITLRLPLNIRNGVGIERRRALWRATAPEWSPPGFKTVRAPDDPSYRRAGSNR